jgi:FtsP/CotA-like multicopper oxidase with cupredoxin domain
LCAGRSIEHDPRGDKLKRQVDVPPQKCGTGADEVDEIFTVNGTSRPRIEIAPGERKFWRIVNASADRYLDIQLDGTPLEIVALDGMPLAYHDPEHPTRTADHLLVVPAGRLEAIVTGPSAQAHAALRTLCVDTGPAGDNNPGMVLADLVFTQFESKGFKPPAARNGQSTPGLQTDEYRKIEEYGSGVNCSFHRRQERFLHQWLEVHSRRACDDQRSRGYISTLAHC